MHKTSLPMRTIEQCLKSPTINPIRLKEEILRKKIQEQRASKLSKSSLGLPPKIFRNHHNVAEDEICGFLVSTPDFDRV